MTTRTRTTTTIDLDLQFCKGGSHAFCDAQEPAECACSCHQWTGRDTGNDVSALYHVYRSDGILDVYLHIIVGTFMRAVPGPKWKGRILPRIEHKSLRTWGIDNNGHAFRRTSFDPAAIRRFLTRFRKERNRGPKELRLVVRTIWQSDRDKGVPFPPEHREPRRQRGQEPQDLNPEDDGAWPWF